MRIKICGITNPEDACEAVRLGVDAIGLNFYAGSPRHVSEETARRVRRLLPPFVEPVGLFVNSPLSEVIAVAGRLHLRTVQWHGDEPPLPPDGDYHFIPAFPLRNGSDLQKVRDYLAACRREDRLPSALLIDGHAPGIYGGTGCLAAWELLADFQPEVPVILAGGLTPENVAEAIRMVRPYAVDVAGGVEDHPGHKSVEKMRRFVENARRAALT